jgi:uncharacterized protein YjbI with pentapeptide repeats
MINKQYVSLFVGLAISASVSAKTTYNPDQLAQFNLTNQCHNCDLSGASFSGNHSGAVFASSNLTGSIGSGTFSQANFSGSNLSSATWSKMNLSYAQMTYMPLINTNFNGSDLSYANFEGAITQGANFVGCNLYGSNISQQQLDMAKSYCNAVLPNGDKKNC